MISDGIRDGFIVEQKHPELDLYLYNYTRKCTFEKAWNIATLLCRGLILDGSGNIISYPLGKFFNWEELSPEERKRLSMLKFDVLDKVDGCLDKETVVITEKGRKTIGWICENNYRGNVLSYDPIKDVFEYKKINNSWIRENIQNWYQLTLEDGTIVKITGNQKVWCSNIKAYRKVEDLDGSEEIVVKS